jgi:tRNA/tmRNA/rRNA uracil-C5-methylase (TrmA/RlmC/RlmD family)
MVPIESLDKEGNGVTLIEWDTMQRQISPTKLLVRGALPGETVRVRVVLVFTKGGSAFHEVRLNVFGRREHLVRPRKDTEPWRSTIEPELLPPGHEECRDLEPFDCPHFDRRHDENACRGCSVPHLNYTRQIIEKTRLLRDSLKGAVDDGVLSSLLVEPRSNIKRFAEKVEVFAFSRRPLETPQWGQLTHKDPLPGERRNKYFIETPKCRIMSKSAQAVLSRLSQLVAVQHAESPSLFSVYDEVINRGYLKSAIIQSCRNRNGEVEVLLSIVTAIEPSPRFRQAIKENIADRLTSEFPLLKGVLLVESKPSLRPSDETGHVELLAGEPTIKTYIESAGREISLGPHSRMHDTEVSEKLIANLCEMIESETSPILELYSGDGSMTGILREISSDVRSLSDNDLKLLLNEGVNPSSSTPILLPPNEPLDRPPIVRAVEEASHAPNEMTAVVSFPPSDAGKAEIKGVTPKEFRHWLGNLVRPKRIVIMTDKFDGLRKDIGHMKLLGYELKSINAFDAKPGVMDRIATIVVMEKKPTYTPLMEGQLIE